MLLVTVLVIICFTWFYNGQNSSRTQADSVATLYERNVTVAQFRREARKFDICQPLGLMEFLESMIGSEARTREQAIESFVWNSMIMRHEAHTLGIRPTDDEVVAAIQKLPPFQTNGAYDSSKYGTFTQNLASLGFTGEQIEELVRDDLRLVRVKSLIGATIAASPSEVLSQFERRTRKTEVSVVRLKREDFSKAVQVNEEDLKKAFEEQKENLKTDELRKVKYVAFLLEKSEKPLVGKEKVAEMSKLADRAQEIAQAMLEKGANFEEVAAKASATVVESPEFTMETPTEEFAQSPAVLPIIFEKLSTEEPNSDVVLAENGYYVFQLTGITPPRPLTYEEAKPKLTTQLTGDRTEEALNLKAAEIRTKLNEQIAAGKPFAEAAAALKLKVETVPAFSLMELPKNEVADGQTIAGRSLDLNEGELSEPTPTADGLFVMHIDKRHPVDEEKFEKEKAALGENIARMKTMSAFDVWLKERRTLAKLNDGSA